MDKPAIYNSEQQKSANVVTEPCSTFVKTFSSQEEAERYQMQQNLAMNDMEKFQKFCRLMRIGKMLSSTNVSSNK